MVAPLHTSRRTALSLTGAALTTAALAACGGNSGRDSDSDSGGGPRVKQWYHQYGEDGTEDAVKKFAEDYSKANVKVSWIPGDYDKKAASALLTTTGPDIFEYGNGPTIDMITGKQVLDLSDLLGDAKSDFTPALLERMTYKGKLYAIPQVADMQLLVYRKSMLKKAGVTPPKTIDELVTAAGKLTTGNVKGLFLGNDGGAGNVSGPVLWATGHEHIRDGKPDFANDDVADALSKFATLFKSGNLLLGSPSDWSEPAAIIQGLTAMQWTGLWTLPTLEKELGDDFGVVPFPSGGSGGEQSVPVGAYAAAVSAKAKSKEAAKDFVKWLWVDQTDKQLEWATKYGLHIPARESLVSKADRLSKGPAKDAARFVQDYGHPQTPLLWASTSSSAYGDAVDKIIRNGANPKKELDAVAKIVTRDLKRIA
ncbi:ABC transporter substrate-binding protein [Demetria terragena]|uniref:ABC transporter substrate-binding protein n=1 Tax=Demetria terragena TaxID=63959 RepID=UPI0003674132|nr:extracellular solute-binding protein [Demetria terragena]